MSDYGKVYKYALHTQVADGALEDAVLFGVKDIPQTTSDMAVTFEVHGVLVLDSATKGARLYAAARIMSDVASDYEDVSLDTCDAGTQIAISKTGDDFAFQTKCATGGKWYLEVVARFYHAT